MVGVYTDFCQRISLHPYDDGWQVHPPVVIACDAELKMRRALITIEGIFIKYSLLWLFLYLFRLSEY